MISETGEYHQPDTEMAPSAGISVSRVPWIFMMEIVCVSEGPFSGAKLKPMCGAASIGTIAASRCASFCPTSNVIRPPLLSPVANSMYLRVRRPVLSIVDSDSQRFLSGGHARVHAEVRLDIVEDRLGERRRIFARAPHAGHEVVHRLIAQPGRDAVLVCAAPRSAEPARTARESISITDDAYSICRSGQPNRCRRSRRQAPFSGRTRPR